MHTDYDKEITHDLVHNSTSIEIKNMAVAEETWGNHEQVHYYYYHHFCDKTLTWDWDRK